MNNGMKMWCKKEKWEKKISGVWRWCAWGVRGFVQGEVVYRADEKSSAIRW